MARYFALALSLLLAGPADARCFLFFCTPHHHHRARKHHRHPRPHLVIVKKTYVIRHAKSQPKPKIDKTPIEPIH